MKYRKKPVIIEAVQFTGNNTLEVIEFIGQQDLSIDSNAVLIPTLEGTMRADINDFIIKGVNGEFYPCKPYIFEKTYEVVKS
ncbi:hypothetical protein [Clostridium botulinum]|uniref:Phage protein n=1 Tax=Clostridium botulinum TaxID=1491 RepID=A0A6B4JHH4_CLOBO|nr:hypothetical protein [Clostridium botulinum]EES48010.1 gp119 [Clostridium botulinum E1 str. 'BoNT E Beluga']MBY6759727.1 hypothetical protein [Clostridium botulinum]MBY6918636.1 hypothetical protein [Clostridium botulinum]NFJ56444.1 hypothetical protein [Clostridium botulinum]NFL51096.1 hypothetical protein [Clostridium botulinum]